MPILNYTTTIEAKKTALEVLGILAEAGARGVSIEYDENRIPAACSFQIEIEGRMVNFRLPSRWEGVYRRLQRDPKVERRYKTPDQARRVAWRIVKDWTEAQLAIIEAEAAELSEVFLPYMVYPRSGRTLFEEFKGGFLLKSGE